MAKEIDTNPMSTVFDKGSFETSEVEVSGRGQENPCSKHL